ncbi:MAG: small, acid-soluble spore protein, alpha/beta type [Bacillota bacterium]
MEEIQLKPSTKSKKKKSPPTMEDLKVEIAEELGLIDKVRSFGWSALTAAESGRIGGIMTKRIKNKSKLDQQTD